MPEAQTTQAPAVNAASLPGAPRDLKPKTPEPLPTTAPVAKASPPALGGSLKESQYLIREYFVPIPVGYEPKDLLDPPKWMHHAKSLKINDKLDCVSISGQWECTLRVVNKGDTWVKMRMLSGYDAEGKDEAATPVREQYKIEFIPTQGHRVVHRESRGVVSSGHQTKDAALQALDEHVEKLSKRQ